MARSGWMKLVMMAAVLLASGALAEAQKGGGDGGDGLKVGGMGVGGHGQLSIAGKVLDPEGNPLAGVEIVVTIEGIEKTFDAKTKKKGKFSLLVPNEDGQYRASALLEGYRHIDTKVASTPDGKVMVDITMEQVPDTDEVPAAAQDIAAGQELVESELSEQQVAAISSYNEGVRAIQEDDRATARAKFTEALAADPELEAALTALASLAFEDKDYPTAAETSMQLLRLDADDPRVFQMAYVSTYMTGDVEGLAMAARGLAAHDPAIVERDMIRNAKSSFEGGRPAICRALMEVAVEARPDLADAQFQLGMCCNAEGDSSCAREAFTEFLELAPEHADAGMVQSLLEYLE